MKKISYLFLLISFLMSFLSGTFFPVEAAISTIQNTAEATYTNDQGEPFNQQSDKRITQIEALFGVSINIPKPGIAGLKLSTWNFPGTITNNGTETDQYKLTIQDLISGLESSIYDDKNGNGIID